MKMELTPTFQCKVLASQNYQSRQILTPISHLIICRLDQDRRSLAPLSKILPPTWQEFKNVDNDLKDTLGDIESEEPLEPWNEWHPLTYPYIRHEVMLNYLMLGRYRVLYQSMYNECQLFFAISIPSQKILDAQRELLQPTSEKIMDIMVSTYLVEFSVECRVF